jgi:lauroyl/myristoyl acyltransferase
MKAACLRYWRALGWRLLRLAHRADYRWFLPAIARLPLPLAYALSGLRGRFNAAMGRDWRSVALQTRHIQRQSLAGYALLPGASSVVERTQWCRERFETEARDELEARLVAARRLHELSCRFVPAGAELVCAGRTRGLVLLTPHFDSFYLGIAFLAQASGGRVNSMSSAVTQDPRVDPAVSRHFDRKYRGLEQYLNGGLVPDIEAGLRPFYRMLVNHETLVVLGDAPVLPNGAAMTADFLGGPRVLAGGALRLAQRTGSDLGGFVCRCLGAGRYELEMCPIGPAGDPQTVARVYRFLSEQILAAPGLWWAADLLPNLPLEEVPHDRAEH